MNTVIITPVRNEGQYIRTTLDCMVNQIELPYKWIIVNDGSTDETGSIVQEYAKKYPFVKHIMTPDRGYRMPAKGVVDAFYRGLQEVKNDEYDILSKFDGDLEFPPDLIHTITSAFKQNAKLGITGAVRYERKKESQQYKKVLVPKGFVGGPCKFYRKECFQDIQGLIRRAGWDGVDAIKANMKGWQTGEIGHLKIIHLKPTGSAEGEGLQKACEKYGNTSYYMGGYFWYFLLRVVVRSMHARNLAVGYYMMKGFMKAKRKHEVRESEEFRTFLKQKQKKNILYWMTLPFKK